MCYSVVVDVVVHLWGRVCAYTQRETTHTETMLPFVCSILPNATAPWLPIWFPLLFVCSFGFCVCVRVCSVCWFACLLVCLLFVVCSLS